jgi:hypothetical protein
MAFTHSRAQHRLPSSASRGVQVAAADRFVKTDAGREELAARTRSLGIVTRRLLILVNGQRSADDLAKLMGPGVNLDLELSNLLEANLIQRTGAETAATVVASAAPAPAPKRGLLQRLLSIGERPLRLDPQTHERMREACMLLHDALGPGADDLTMRLEDCASPEALEAAQRWALDVVASVRGREQAETLRRAMGLAAGD